MITRAELFAGRHVDPRQLEELLGAFREHPVDRSVAVTGGRLRRRNPDMLLPDALIAATARVHHRTLITRNQSAFTAVPDLALGAPSDLPGRTPD